MDFRHPILRHLPIRVSVITKIHFGNTRLNAAAILSARCYGSAKRRGLG
jgi:hypothetical protein